jgi:RimJ/RimL family protein N-acetyltransferase
MGPSTTPSANTAHGGTPENVVELRTDRLLMRPWRESDREPFAALNRDPLVMEHFPSTLSRTESDRMVDRIEATFAGSGPRLWAVEVLGGPSFIGFVGLSAPGFAAPFTPCVEVGWRLACAAWGHGYATEAGRAALADGCGRLGLSEIVSFTTATNLRSQRVMQRLGMTRDPADDFDHPRIAVDHPLRRHVLYRVRTP